MRVAQDSFLSSVNGIPKAKLLRLSMVALILILIAVLAWKFPVVPEESWPLPYLFEPDDAVCREERQARQWTRYRVPEEAGWATVADVARKLSIDEGWICRANGWEAECGHQRVEEGDTLILPLYGALVEEAGGADRLGTAGAPER